MNPANLLLAINWTGRTAVSFWKSSACTWLSVCMCVYLVGVYMRMRQGENEKRQWCKCKHAHNFKIKKIVVSKLSIQIKIWLHSSICFDKSFKTSFTPLCFNDIFWEKMLLSVFWFAYDVCKNCLWIYRMLLRMPEFS